MFPVHLRLSSFFLVVLFVMGNGGVASPVRAQSYVSETYSFDKSSLANYQIDGAVITGNGVYDTWYDAAWKYRQKITISQDYVGEDLSDFPLLVRLDDTSVYQYAHSDGLDIVFTAADGRTRLSHSMESATEFWVKVPTVSGEHDTVLFVYYGNPNAMAREDANDVWSNGYVGVWQMNDEVLPNIEDSTGNGHEGTPNGAMNKEDSRKLGKIGRSLDFDGTNDYVNLGSAAALEPELLTACAWFMRQGNNDTSYAYPFTNSHFSAKTGYKMFVRSSNINWSVFGGGASSDLQYSVTVDPSTWYYACGQYDGTKTRLFVDGVERGSKTTAFSPSTSRSLFFGAEQDFGPKSYFNGQLDHITISNTARSATWIAAEHANQCNCEAFLTISDTVETNTTTSSDSTATSTIQLKADRPLFFNSLSSFTPNGSDQITYQLSNDGGMTWFFYTKEGWTSANPNNPHHRSSANDINGHLNTFPQGEGKLLWRAYLPSGTSVDSIQIGYESGTTTSGSAAVSPATSLSDFRIQSLNTLFRSAFHRTPTAAEWTHWVTRMLTEGKPLDAWLGAMEWQDRFGQ